MTIGTSILLLVLGAIFTWAVEVPIPGIDSVVLGYILMAAGALGLVIGLIMMTQRSAPKKSTQVTRAEGPDGVERRYETERRYE